MIRYFYPPENREEDAFVLYVHVFEFRAVAFLRFLLPLVLRIADQIRVQEGVLLIYFILCYGFRPVPVHLRLFHKEEMLVRPIQPINSPCQCARICLRQEGIKLNKWLAVQPLPLALLPVMLRPVLQHFVIEEPCGAADIPYI